MFHNKTLAIGALALSLCAGASQAGETLTMAYPWAPTHPTVTGGWTPMIEKIEAETDLKMQPIYGGGLLGAREMVSGVSSGVADMGMLLPPYFPAEFPHGALLGDLAMFSRGAYVTGAAVTELGFISDAWQQEYVKNGLVWLGSYGTTGYSLLTKKPITSVADLKGLRIRAPGGSFDRWVRSVGGVPVNMPGGETYEALSRSIIDVGMLPTGDLESYSLFDVVSNVNEVNVGAFFSWSLYAFNKGSWAGLTEDQRKLFIETSIDTAIDIGHDAVLLDEASREKAQAQGIQIDANQDIIANLDAFRDKDIGVVVSSAEEKGIADAGEFVNTFIALLDKYEKLFAGHEEDPEAMKEILRAEILPKIDMATYGL